MTTTDYILSSQLSLFFILWDLLFGCLKRVSSYGVRSRMFLFARSWWLLGFCFFAFCFVCTDVDVFSRNPALIRREIELGGIETNKSIKYKKISQVKVSKYFVVFANIKNNLAEFWCPFFAESAFNVLLGEINSFFFSRKLFLLSFKSDDIASRYQTT